MKYIIERKKCGRWLKTWWTSHPQATVEEADPIVSVSKSKANRMLKIAQKLNPGVEYRVTEAK